MKYVYRLWIIVSTFLCTQLYGQAVVDADLRQALLSSTSVDVIVTFKGTGAVTPAHITVLKQLGITRGVAFTTFPIAGVVATPAQVNMLAQRSDIRSLYLNKPVTFYN